MELLVTVESQCLIFRSQRYVLQWRSNRIAIPGIFCPGKMEIVHKPISPSQFSFRLSLHHPWLGLILTQEAVYFDA
jgi:Domain of unknown function (DUF4166)